MHWTLSKPEPYNLHNDRTYLVSVDAEPRRRKVGGVELSLRVRAQVVLHNQKIESKLRNQRVLCKATELPWKNLSRAEIGDSYFIRANFRRLLPSHNPFAYESNLLRHGYSATCKIRYTSPPLEREVGTLGRLRLYLQDKVQRVLGDTRHSALFLSMGFGVRDLLSDKIENTFRYCGLTHLLVFSGAQVMLVYYFVSFLCRLFLRHSFAHTSAGWFWLSVLAPLTRLFSTIGLVCALSVAAIAGFDASCLRAAISAVFLVIGNVWERPTRLLDSICCSLYVLCLIWPGCFFEPGTQLTYAALAGIFCASLISNKSILMRYVASCFSVWIITSPVTYLWFDYFSPFSFLFNLIFAAPLAFISCSLGYLALLFYITGLDPYGYCLRFCAACLGLICDWLVSISDSL